MRVSTMIRINGPAADGRMMERIVDFRRVEARGFRHLDRRPARARAADARLIAGIDRSRR